MRDGVVGLDKKTRVGEPASSSASSSKSEIQEGDDDEAHFKAETSLKRPFSEAMPEDTAPALRDSRAGSSADAMVDLVEIVHFAESTIKTHLESAKDILHESTSVTTDTFGDMVDLKKLVCMRSRRSNSHRN